MAFRTNTPLQSGFSKAIDIATQEKNYLTAWQSKLSGNISGLDAIAMQANLNQVIPVFTAVAAIPGVLEYGQQQYNDAAYDVGSEFTAMLAALTAIKDWITTNIPVDAVTVENGVLVGKTYTPAQTAPLLVLVAAARNTIA